MGPGDRSRGQRNIVGCLGYMRPYLKQQNSIFDVPS